MAQTKQATGSDEFGPTDEDTACTDGTSCVPWYADGQAPDACLGMAGICANL